MVSRRAFLATGALGSAALATAAFGRELSDTTFDLEVTETEIRIQDLPLTFEGYRIGFTSDLHLGRYVPSDWIDKVIQSLVLAEVDLGILGGDYTWIPSAVHQRSFPTRNNRFVSGVEKRILLEIYETLTTSLSKFTPKDGVFAVLGNHDNWNNGKLCKEHLEKNSIKFLINESVELKRGKETLRLSGVDDYWTGVPEIPSPNPRSPKSPHIVISHNPDYLSSLLQHLKHPFDLGLSGHTHGGQVCFPLTGAISYNVKDTRFSAGLAKVRAAQVYTTRGIGVVEVPYRINCRPEVSILSLTRA